MSDTPVEILITVALNDDQIDQLSTFVIRLPRVGYPGSTVVNAVALQLLAYYAASLRGCPIDFPRNIAKSVTVE